MKILLDHNLDWRLARALPNHEVMSTLKMGWAALENGELLAAAEREGFAVMLTADKNIKRQQTMVGRTLGLIVLRAPNNKLKTHLPMLGEVEAALVRIAGGEVIEIYHLALKPG